MRERLETTMALEIKNPRAARLAGELAQRTGEPLDEAVTLAIEERLARMGGSRAGRPRREVVEAICRGFRALPDVDTRSVDEILGYDDNGLF